MKKKILTVLGARPQFIKSKVLSDILKKHKNLTEVIVHTGQHYDFKMYKGFLKELSLPKPSYFLGVNKGSNRSQVLRIVEKINPVIKKEKPQLIIVYGDTNSTLAGALAAKENNIPLAHIEAGLRSYNIEMAEEFNRITTDKIATLLFVPVKEARHNLNKEGIKKGVYLTGDVLYDVMLKFSKNIARQFIKISKDYSLVKNEYYLLTLHRAETVDNPDSLKLILTNLGKLDYRIIFPVHPRTYKRIKQFRLKNLLAKVACVLPQNYLTTLSLIKNSRAVLTDSGGVQREAYMLKSPCITLRNETEWNETLSFGWNKLVGVDKNSLARLPLLLRRIKRPRRYRYIFGKGKAASIIIKQIENFLLKY